MSPPQADIEEHVARITASSGFSNSERLCELLRYTVTEALAGRGFSLKESVLGVTVFGRKPGYNSDTNSIVRVEFARLRKKLEQYYEGEGVLETWRILFPKGNYVPEFIRTEQGAAPAYAGSVVVLPFTCPSKALEIDPLLPEAHCSLALVDVFDYVFDPTHG